MPRKVFLFCISLRFPDVIDYKKTFIRIFWTKYTPENLFRKAPLIAIILKFQTFRKIHPVWAGLRVTSERGKLGARAACIKATCSMANIILLMVNLVGNGEVLRCSWLC